jgi:hypothetical protein
MPEMQHQTIPISGINAKKAAIPEFLPEGRPSHHIALQFPAFTSSMTYVHNITPKGFSCQLKSRPDHLCFNIAFVCDSIKPQHVNYLLEYTFPVSDMFVDSKLFHS